MTTVLRYYLNKPAFGPITVGEGAEPLFGEVTKVGGTKAETPRPTKRGRQTDLEWARASYPWLKEFADSELIVNPGHYYQIMVHTEHPDIRISVESASGVQLNADRRIDAKAVVMIELSMNGVQHSGTVLGAHEWPYRPMDDRFYTVSYAENLRGRHGEFDGNVLVQSTVRPGASREPGDHGKILQRMLSSLLHGRAHALGILKLEAADK